MAGRQAGLVKEFSIWRSKISQTHTVFFCYKCGTNHSVSFRSSLDWSFVGVGQWQWHSGSSSDTIADPSAKSDNQLLRVGGLNGLEGLSDSS